MEAHPGQGGGSGVWAGLRSVARASVGAARLSSDGCRFALARKVTVTVSTAQRARKRAAAHVGGTLSCGDDGDEISIWPACDASKTASPSRSDTRALCFSACSEHATQR
eukprot:6182103-Pleurochrysis_carterae.AAC.1